MAVRARGQGDQEGGSEVAISAPRPGDCPLKVGAGGLEEEARGGSFSWRGGPELAI